MNKVRLRLLTCSAILTLAQQEYLTKPWSEDAVSRLFEEDAFDSGRYHQDLNFNTSSQMATILISRVWLDQKRVHLRLNPTLEVVCHNKREFKQKKWHLLSPRRAVDVINNAEFATMLPAKTSRAGYLVKACYTNQGSRHAALLFGALGRWQFDT
jgi:hypothetical protein